MPLHSQLRHVMALILCLPIRRLLIAYAQKKSGMCSAWFWRSTFHSFRRVHERIRTSDLPLRSWRAAASGTFYKLAAGYRQILEGMRLGMHSSAHSYQQLFIQFSKIA